MPKKTEEEIRNQSDMAHDWSIQGKTKYPSMTYEEGVEAALNWVLGEGFESDEPPISNSVFND